MLRPTTKLPTPSIRRSLSASVKNTPPLILSPADFNRLSGDVVAVDASWHMPNSGRRGSVEYEQKRLKDARFLDLDAVASTGHPLALPHMMPPASLFAKTCQDLGIRRNSHVVLYDSTGVFSSPRALFMFKTFGHNQASILDGGLPRWEAEGNPLISGKPTTTMQMSNYSEPTLDGTNLRDYDHMKQNASQPVGSQETDIVFDARAAGRFQGTAPEPRPGLPSGHIPHSLSLPFNLLLQTHNASPGPSYTTLRDADELRQLFGDLLGSDRLQLYQEHGLKRIVNTCGSGMSAAIIWLALQQIGIDSALYDESWMGYAARAESNIATGA